MIRLFSLVSLFIGLCISAAAQERSPNDSFAPTPSWDTNVYTGESLAREIKPGHELSGYRSYDRDWRTVFDYYQPIRGLSGSAALHQQPLQFKPQLPGKGGWLPRDLVDRYVVQDLPDDAKEYVKFEAIGHALFTYVRGSEPPILPLFYWTLDSEGYLLVSIDEDLPKTLSQISIDQTRRPKAACGTGWQGI